MAEAPTPVTFELTLPGGGPVSGGKVTFTLSNLDLDGGIILPTTVEGFISETGTGTVNLWPNVAGLKSSSYKVAIAPSNGSKVDVGSIVVPESATAVALHTLIPLGQVAGLTTVVLTQAEYDALEEKSSQVLYLIRAEA